MPSVRAKTANAAAKWLRRAIPQSRVSNAVLGGICEALGEQLGGNPYVELRSLASTPSRGGRIEFVRTLNTKEGLPRGIFYLPSREWDTDIAVSSHGQTVNPRVVHLKNGRRLWDMHFDGVKISTAGINPRTGEQWDDSGCAIHAIWCAVHSGTKSYRTIKTLLGIIENLRRGTLRRNIGEKGVFTDTINHYIGHYGLRLDKVHREHVVSVEDRRRALENIYNHNQNCLMILRCDDGWHALAVHGGVPVGLSERDVYGAADFESIDSVSIPIWGGGK